MWNWLDTLVQGLLLGGLYALFAIGLSLAFGVMRLVNIAHGDLIVLGAFLGLAAVHATGIDPLVSLVIVVPVMCVLGYALQRGILNWTMSDDIMPSLLVTFGLSVIIQNVLLQVFSADSQGLSLGTFDTASLHLGGQLAIGWFPLLIAGTAVALIFGLQQLFARTSLGRAFRATSDDREVAELMGLNSRHIYGLALGLAMGLVAVAGIYFGIRSTFSPTSGPAQLLLAFEAVIIGGLGSFWGTLAGGTILGLAQAIGYHLNPNWGVLAGHLAFLAVLVVRPQGLFPRTRDR